MITEIRITTKEQVQELSYESNFDINTNRHRSSCIYRGLKRENYKLLTSLQRDCKNKSDYLEPFLLRNFAKYVSIIDPTIDESDWKAMIIGQHHGLPTRLLDWTISIPMALHFATAESDLTEMSNHNCVVWKIDVDEINNHLPKNYKEAKDTEYFTLKELQSVANTIDDYDKDLKDNAFVTIEPPSIDQRIVNQYSFFTIMPKELKSLDDYLDSKTNKSVKYIIDKDLRWYIRDILDQWNINERTVYPGLDGIATWLKRYYYVK